MADIITGVAELERAFLDLKGTTGRVVHSSLQRIGLLAQREAKANAPRSPTNKILSATLKRKKRTSRKMMPGGLEKSIVYEILPGDAGVSGFVPQNGLCRSKKWLQLREAHPRRERQDMVQARPRHRGQGCAGG